MTERTSMRTYGLVLVVVMMTALAGCGGGGDGGGTACGPGEDEIGSLSSGGGLSTITGEVTEIGDGGFFVTDGTGTAFVSTSDTDYSSGTCLTVEGIPQSAGDVDADIAMSSMGISEA